MLLEYIWLIPLFPALGTLFNGIFGKRFPKPVVHWIACGLVFLSFALSILCVAELAKLEPKVFQQELYTWIPGGSTTTTLGPNAGQAANLNIPFGFLLDPPLGKESGPPEPSPVILGKGGQLAVSFDRPFPHPPFLDLFPLH